MIVAPLEFLPPLVKITDDKPIRVKIIAIIPDLPFDRQWHVVGFEFFTL